MIFTNQQTDKVYVYLCKRFKDVSLSQKKAWRSQQNYLNQCSQTDELMHALHQFEQPLPGEIGSLSMDQIVYLKTNRRILGFPIEQKQWTPSNHVVFDSKINGWQVFGKPSVDPAEQCISYCKQMDFSMAKELLNATFFPIVLMLNASTHDLPYFQKHEKSVNVKWATVDTLEQIILSHLEPAEIILPFDDREMDILEDVKRSNRIPSIPEIASLLTGEQLLIANEIKHHILEWHRNGRKTPLYIPMMPERSYGIGKSYIMLHVYESLRNDFRIQMINGNRALSNNLNHQLNTPSLVISTVHLNANSLQHIELCLVDEAQGIAEENYGRFDLIPLFRDFLKPNRALVLFGDPSQRKVPLQIHWKKRLTDQLNVQEIDLEIKQYLQTQFRCRYDVNALIDAIWNGSSFQQKGKPMIHFVSNIDQAMRIYQEKMNYVSTTNRETGAIMSLFDRPWISQKNSAAFEFCFSHSNLQFQWNLPVNSHQHQPYVLDPVTQVGYYHTTIGQSFDHIMVLWSGFQIDSNHKWKFDRANYRNHDTNLSRFEKKPKAFEETLKDMLNMMMARGKKTLTIYVPDPDTCAYLNRIIS